ncbi:MAG TPA: hypothetical protein VJZ71_10260 [Phycisphaerae bacterium]|nr:hypothetical protein [Phycisphaerae bacterium]
MRPRNAILRFLALFILIYALLILPWPGLADAYVATTNAVGARLLGTIGKVGSVAYERDPSRRWTSKQTMYDRSAKVAMAVRRGYDSRQDYLATALVVALILATPISGRRKALALAMGLLLINVFILWRIWIGLVDIFSEKPLEFIQLSPFWKEVVRLAVQIFVGSIEATFIVPVFVWIVVSLRRADLDQLTSKRPGRASPGTAGP